MIAELIKTIRSLVFKLLYTPELPIKVILVDPRYTRLHTATELAKTFGWFIILAECPQEPVRFVDLGFKVPMEKFLKT